MCITNHYLSSLRPHELNLFLKWSIQWMVSYTYLIVSREIILLLTFVLNENEIDIIGSTNKENNL